MTLSLATVSTTVFSRGLGTLDRVLDASIAYCEARKVDPAVLAATRLIPDMFAMSRQVQIACDHVVRGMARLTGVEAPSIPDTETTLVELKARVATARAYLEAANASAISDGGQVEFSRGPAVHTMESSAYFLQFAMPNFMFHVTTAYNIARAAGVEIGKRDFVGPIDSVAKG